MSIIIATGKVNPKYYHILIIFTPQPYQLNQSNLLLTPFYEHKVQLISNCILHLLHMTCFVNYFFYSCTEALIFVKITLDCL